MPARLPIAVALLVFTVGCGGGPGAAISTPSYDPDGAARDALKQFDKNNDGAVDGAELDATPGLKAAFGGKKVTADALKARLEQYRGGGAGLVGYSVKVTRGTTPLFGATVTFTPEPFLSDTIREATASTGNDGVAASFVVNGQVEPGLPPGMYRVSVTKSGESIPAAFTAGTTTVGCEVFGGRGGSSSLDVKIPGP